MGVQLTHSQAVNRLEDIRIEIARLAEKEANLNQDERMSDEDRTYWADLMRELDEVNYHKETLERAADLAKVRSLNTGRVRNAVVAGNTERGSGQAPSPRSGNSAGAGYDRDAILEPDSVEDCRFRDPWDLSDVRAFGRSKEEVNGELRARAISACEKMPSADDKIRQAAVNIIERYDNADAEIARMVLVSSSPAYMRGWSKMATNRAHLLSADESRALEAVRAMSLTDTAGGYLVPFQLDPTVIITANGSTNPIRGIARTVVATGDVWNGISSSAVAWSWDAEATQVSDDSTTFAQPTVPVYKASGFVPISIEALEDSANVAATVGELLAFGRDVLESAAFTLGSGAGQPTGIVTALTGTSSVVASAGADVLAVGDVYATQAALPARYRANAAWLTTNAIANRIRQFDTAGGSALWAQLGADTPPVLLGRPLYEAEDMDSTLTATVDNYVAVFGDFRNYVIADRVGMTVEFIPHLFGAAGRPTGQRGWYAYYRVGADSVNDAAFRMLNVT